MTPAEIIFTNRERLGMTQDQLAFEVATSARTVRRWESGESRPRNSHLLRLASLFQIDPEVFVQ